MTRPASAHATGRPAGLSTGRPADLSTDRTTGRLSDRPAVQSAARPAVRSTDRPAGRNRSGPGRHAATWAAMTLVAVPVLAGCSQAIGVAAAPHAADPDCARVVLALPQTLGDDLERVRTSSQATAAWGSTEKAVTLRCGVEVPPPTTDQCVTVETASGSSIDWLVRADAEPADAAPATAPAEPSTGTGTANGTGTGTGTGTDAGQTPDATDPALNPGASDWTFVTYGRDPAVEVHVPADIAAERSTSFLDDLSIAITRVEATRACV